MSTLSPSSAATPHPQRPPPPSLFLGPPSRNASNISLGPSTPTTTTTTSQPRPPPLLRSRTATRPQQPAQSFPPSSSRHQKQTEGDRTEALWAEMQATLAEVEQRASSEQHVFGKEHSAALEELREAQIALARAWGREEEEDDDNDDDGMGIDGDEGKGKGKGKEASTGDAEADEEGDLAEAKRRREANERVFARVEDGVADVVGKLEEVARAMEKVGRESREVWNGSESMDSGSVATEP